MNVRTDSIGAVARGLPGFDVLCNHVPGSFFALPKALDCVMHGLQLEA
jgi:hypothetical protein